MNRFDHALLDHVSTVMGAKNDAALARGLKVAPPVISKIRCGRNPVTPAILIIIHEATGIELKTLRFLIGDFKESTKASAQTWGFDEVHAHLVEAGCKDEHIRSVPRERTVPAKRSRKLLESAELVAH